MQENLPDLTALVVTLTPEERLMGVDACYFRPSDQDIECVAFQVRNKIALRLLREKLIAAVVLIEKELDRV